MVRLVGSAEAWELLGMSQPGEVAAIHHATAYLCGKSVHILGGRVGDNVGSPLEWTAVYWRSKGVIDNQGYTIFVSYPCKLLYVEHGTTRICDGLAEQGLCVRTESLLDILLAGIR